MEFMRYIIEARALRKVSVYEMPVYDLCLNHHPGVSINKGDILSS